MSRSLIYGILGLLWLIFGCFLCNKYFCSGSNVTAATPAVLPIIAEKCDASLSISDGNNFRVTSDRSIGFLKSSFQNSSYDSATKNALEKMITYLSKETDLNLEITGKYESTESYNGVLPNLGVARATTLKEALVKMGLAPNRMEVTGVLHNNLCTSGDTMTNSVVFGFSDASKTTGRIAEIKNRLFGKPITLYFETNSDDITLNSQQKRDFADLTFYLDNVPEARLSVEGHTDDRGESKYNKKLSINRAEFVMKYIIDKLNLNSSKLSNLGLGETKPINTNDTPEGRAKNRRVEVILK